MKISIPRKPRILIDRLLANGFEAGLVGGCLRNLLLGLPIKDYDIATSATTKEMKMLFQDLVIISPGEKFGTLIIVVEGENIEATTFRKEEAYRDNRHPDKVSFVNNLEEDLGRRDFTINAFYYNNQRGLVDLYGSRKDLEGGIIRTVGDPLERFKEDSLRILRALRFAARLSFKIDEGTREGIYESYHLLSNIKTERIAIELVDIVCSKGSGTIIGEYLPVLQYVVFGLETPDTELIDRMPGNKLKLAAFFLALEKNLDPYDSMMKMKLTVSRHIRKSDLKDIAFIIETARNGLQDIYEIYRRSRWNKELVSLYFSFIEKEDLVETLPDKDMRDLAIKGSDLIKMGYEKNSIAEMLDQCFLHVLKKQVDDDYRSLCDLVTELYPKEDIIRLD